MSALMSVSLFAGTVGALNAVAEPSDAETLAEVTDMTTPTDEGAYLFVHFIDEEQTEDKEQLYFSVSKNGTSWRTLNGVQPVLDTKTLDGGTGGIRDPHIIRSPEGDKFYMIATDLSIYNLRDLGNEKWGYSQEQGSQSIVIWESTDLVNWSEPRLRKVGTDNAGCVWAPESIWDKEKKAYMVFWASRLKDYWKHCIYRSYTTDFDTFTEPEVYIESDDSRIDTTIYEKDGVYYRFTKNEGGSAKYVYMERGTSLSGDFEIVSTYTLDGQRYDANGHLPFEGPTVYKLHGQERWCLLLDSFNYRPFETDDISKGRFVSAAAFDFGGTLFRHGTVLPITMAEYQKLIDKYENGEDIFEEDATEGDLVYALDFNENLNVASGSTVTTAVTKMGSGVTGYVDGVNGGKAIQLTSDNYLKLPSETLAGYQSVTVSFAAKVDANASWLFYAAPNDNEIVGAGHKEEYLGAGWKLDGYEGIRVQRFKNNGSRPAMNNASIPGQDQWFHVTIVFRVGKTELYINGERRGGVSSSVSLKQLLGSDPTVYLGRANWGDGEFASAAMDCFKIYNYVLDAEAIAELYKSDMGSDAVEPEARELVYSLDFENNLEAGTGTLTTAATGTNGLTYTDGVKDGKAIKLSANNYVTVPSAALAGYKSATVSFAAKVDNNRSWMFYAAPNDKEPSYPNEHYLGAGWKLDGYEGIRVQRYDNSGSRSDSIDGGIPGTNQWFHVTIVFNIDNTELYINGELAAEKDSAFVISEMLGSEPVIYLGRAMWGGGEYATAAMDCFKIYNYARSADEVLATYKSDMGIA